MQHLLTPSDHVGLIEDAFDDDEWRERMFASLFLCAVESHVLGRPDYGDESAYLHHDAVRETLEADGGLEEIGYLVSLYPDPIRQAISGWIDAGCPNVAGHQPLGC